ncbi:MAG: glycerol kinase [Candidatus Lokiarchaeota archaeon]|nr:glycerol kinase [Candidatus Lokiarchaeota archaeon]
MANILVIDSGGSGIRAMIFNDRGQIVAREYEKTPPILSEPGALEHDPQVLWEALLSVVKRLIAGQKLASKDIAAMGVCNQRASFVLWDKSTGKPLTKLISWADVRAAKTCDAMNHDPKWKQLKGLAKFVAALTGKAMFTATSLLNFTTDHASIRLKWVLDQDPALKARCKAGEIRFGTLDTWFIHKLTGGKVHATDVTNAGATGLYNPFELKWNEIFFKLFDIDASLFPEVKDSNGDFGTTDPAAFAGLSIPIRAAAGDQMAALFGQRCFEAGSVKISQGSGAFVDLNVGPKPKLSKRGLNPMIAWRINGQIAYMLEGFVATAGTLIDWLGGGIGLSDTPKVLNELAAECTDTAGVVFVPTNSGIRFPYFNPEARGCIFGLSLSTHRRHVARAVLEGIALSLHEVIYGMAEDTKVPITTLKVDGGVSKSDILLQCLADFANVSVNRAPEPDMTATGIAYMAGLGAGIWKDLDDLKKIEQNYQAFEPRMNAADRQKKLGEWKKAIQAVLNMYSSK